MAGDRVIGARMVFGWVIQYNLSHYCASRHGFGSPEDLKVVTTKEQWKVGALKVAE
jgi:hypothetical protein